MTTSHRILVWQLKEMVVAYSFLLSPVRPRSARELDAAIEEWFRRALDCEVDFEVADALDKLAGMGLAACEAGLWRVVPLDAAKRRLDERWDACFEFDGQQDVAST